MKPLTSLLTTPATLRMYTLPRRPIRRCVVCLCRLSLLLGLVADVGGSKQTPSPRRAVVMARA
jgi:hypothetical protein